MGVKIKNVLDGSGVKFYPITIANAVAYIKQDSSQVKLSDFLNSIDYSGKADKVSGATNGNFAGLDSNGNLTDSGSKASDFATAAQGAKADSAVQSVSLASGTNNGTVKLTVDGVDTDNIAVTGLGSAAYTASTAYDAAGAAAAVLGTSTDAATDNTVYGAKAYSDANKAAVIGASGDAASANTIYGAKAYADALVAGGVIYQGTVNAQSDLPDGSTTAKEYKKGWYYKVATAGTYFGVALQVGDALLANKDYTTGATAANDWDILQGSVAVSSEDADLVIGTLTKIATVEGVEIKVKQVEDTTKLECAAVADTTDYPDVTSLFTAPAGE